MSRLRGFLRRRAQVARLENKPAPAGAVERSSAPETPRARTRSDQWRDCLERLLALDGYIVQPSSEEMAAGSIQRMWGSDLAFEITGEASYDDALRQWRVWIQISGDDEMEPPAPASKYYKFGARA
ncbi:MAG TPA: hypothetical protein VK812_13315 [Candidatus Binatus sp.]|jgi:hypothetical protein|nr:hypothetical protein [Candidatus Binatus sp.]